MNAKRAKYNALIAAIGTANCAIAYAARVHAASAPARSELHSSWRHIQAEYESLARDSANALSFNPKGDNCNE